MMNDTSEKRQNWIDVLKGIGIILVVIGHVRPSGSVTQWIYTFHMPLFFALSGYLWSWSIGKQISFKDFLIKRVKTILLPFVLFRVLLVVYWLIVESHFRELDLGPIWFLIVLFVAEVIAFLIFGQYRNKLWLNAGIFVIAATVLYILKLIAVDESGIGAWIMRCVNGFMWYVAGHSIGVALPKRRVVLGRCKQYALLFTLLIVSIAICVLNEDVSMWSNVFGHYGFYIVGSISGVLLSSLFCKWIIGTNKAFEFLGQNTILILATHEPIKRVLLKAIEVLCGVLNVNITAEIIQENIVLSMSVVCLILLIEIMVIYIFRWIRKYSPKVVQDNILIFYR